VKGCRHTPTCPTNDPWVCSQRTITEQAVAKGKITREDGARLLRKWGTVMTPASKVFTGQVVTPSLFKSEF
jgi:hypothetical protein